MSNERIKILKMLENGEITADEASKLLSSIEGKSSSYTSDTYNNNVNNNNDSGQSIDFNKIVNKLTNTTQILVKKTSKIYNDLEKEVKNIFKNVNSGTSSKNSVCKEFNIALNDTDNNLDLKSLNGEMVLKGYNGDKLTLKVVYIPKTVDATIDFYNTDNKKYVLTFKEDNFEKVSLEALVPKKYFEVISISGLNCNFSLDNLNFEKILTDTTNCNGIIENCEGQDININNVNGKLIIRNIKSNNLKVCNINCYVKLKNTDVKNLSIDVLNGEIDVTSDYLNLFNDYNWKLETQNNSINVEINTDNINYDIDARTSLGKINILKNNLVYSEKSDYRVKAKTENKNELFKNLNLSLDTANSTIIVS